MHSNWFSGKGEKAAGRLKIIAVSVIGCIVTLQLGAFSVVVETSLSGIADIPFGVFCAIMQPIHLAIGLVEGLITAAVLVFIYNSRPEILMDYTPAEGSTDKRSYKTVIAVLAVAAVLVGGVFSLFASSNPDGLEWSLFGNEEAGYSANLGLDEDDYGYASDAAAKAEAVQEKTSFLPDYAFSSDAENPAGTSVSGLVGSAMVAAAAVLICLIGGYFRKHKNKKTA